MKHWFKAIGSFILATCGLGYAGDQTHNPEQISTFSYNATHYNAKGERNDLQISFVGYQTDDVELYYLPYAKRKPLGHIQFPIPLTQRAKILNLMKKFSIDACEKAQYTPSPDNAIRHITIHRFVPDGTATDGTRRQAFLIGQYPASYDDKKLKRLMFQRKFACGDMKGLETALLSMFSKIKKHYVFSGDMPMLKK